LQAEMDAAAEEIAGDTKHSRQLCGSFTVSSQQWKIWYWTYTHMKTTCTQS